MAESHVAPEYGYPTPGPQHVPVDKIMTDLYFMTDREWNKDRTTGDFDYVVIGSSFCALGFTHQMLKNNPKAKILIIERGAYFHPEHFQNLPPAYYMTVGGRSETFHWNITKKTHEGEYIKWQHGMNNFFGGRSSFWSAWCPKPTREEMAEWPDEVITAVHEYFPRAEELLNVVPSNMISSNEGKKNVIFGELQQKIYDLVKCAPSEIEAITRVDFAPLAVKADMYRNEDYQKFSASGPLLNMLLATEYNSSKEGKDPPLKIVTNCLVTKIRQENGRATYLETTKNDFTLGNAKLILAMGTLPPTTLMLNSFPASSFCQLSNIGKRFTSHFISSIIARVAIDDMENSLYVGLQERALGKLEMGALYIAGENTISKHQFHIQLTAVVDETPIENIYDTFRHLPDVVAAPSLEQLLSSKDPPHVVFVCACLGQLDHDNKDNWFQLNDHHDLSSNATLQVVANEKDNQLWDTMDETTFNLLSKYLATPDKLEYWHSDGTWKKDQPPKDQIRVPGLVHEASTMWIGNDQDQQSPVDLDYRFRGVENVYLTGGALWPTGASWNPTCAMTAMAMHLADKLGKK